MKQPENSAPTVRFDDNGSWHTETSLQIPSDSSMGKDEAKYDEKDNLDTKMKQSSDLKQLDDLVRSLTEL